MEEKKFLHHNSPIKEMSAIKKIEKTQRMSSTQIQTIYRQKDDNTYTFLTYSITKKNTFKSTRIQFWTLELRHVDKINQKSLEKVETNERMKKAAQLRFECKDTRGHLVYQVGSSLLSLRPIRFRHMYGEQESPSTLEKMVFSLPPTFCSSVSGQVVW